MADAIFKALLHFSQKDMCTGLTEVNGWKWSIFLGFLLVCNVPLIFSLDTHLDLIHVDAIMAIAKTARYGNILYLRGIMNKKVYV